MEKGIYEEVVGEDNDLINSIVSTYSKFKESMKPSEAPGVSMASVQDTREIYCEVNKKHGFAAEVNVNWKLKNTKQSAWPSKLQLIPIMASPTVRCHFDSNICQLQGMKSGNLKLNIEIPPEFDSNSLVMVLKLKTNKKIFVGPTLVLYVKINPFGNEREIKMRQKDPVIQDVKADLIRINQGIDVYAEP